MSNKEPMPMPEFANAMAVKAETGRWMIYVNPYTVTTAEEYIKVRDDVMQKIADKEATA